MYTYILHDLMQSQGFSQRITCTVSAMYCWMGYYLAACFLDRTRCSKYNDAII